MDSIELIRLNLVRSAERVLLKIDEMRPHALVPATPGGGAHTLWVLGHLAYVEGLVVRELVLGEANPIADWAELFDGAAVSTDPSDYPAFDDVLARCRRMRGETLGVLGSLDESDLDRASARVPDGFEDTFGTYRDALQYLADHWYMHRGQLAGARRAAGVDRMWV